eukprot:3388418-Rhodomonas_salina.3
MRLEQSCTCSQHTLSQYRTSRSRRIGREPHREIACNSRTVTRQSPHAAFIASTSTVPSPFTWAVPHVSTGHLVAET